MLNWLHKNTQGFLAIERWFYFGRIEGGGVEALWTNTKKKIAKPYTAWEKGTYFNGPWQFQWSRQYIER